jgi:hypothetical protein
LPRPFPFPRPPLPFPFPPFLNLALNPSGAPAQISFGPAVQTASPLK